MPLFEKDQRRPCIGKKDQLMNMDEKNIELIESFYKGNLRGEELRAFNQKRREDRSFDQEVEDYLLIFESIKNEGEREFLNNLKNWENEISQKQETPVYNINRILAVAATVLVLIIPLTYWWISEQSSVNSNDLFVAYFQPYDDVVSERSNEVDDFQVGMSAYNNNNYEQAIKHLKLVREQDSNKNAANLYLGIAYLANNQPDDAEQLFSLLKNSDDGLYKEVAEWNLVLTYLKKDKTDLLEKELNNILRRKSHLFKKDAERLKNDLKM